MQLSQGPLLKKSLSGGLRTIKNSEISNRTIRKVVGRLNVSKYGESFIKKGLIKKQAGGLRPDEIAETIQEGVWEGKFTKYKGKEISKELGLTKRYYKKIKGLSEFGADHKNNNISGNKKETRAVQSVFKPRENSPAKSEVSARPASSPNRNISTASLKSPNINLPSNNTESKKEADENQDKERKATSIYELLGKHNN